MFWSVTRMTGIRKRQTVEAMERPQTRYVDVGGAEVGYQIVGQGPPDVIEVHGFSHLDLRWEDPEVAPFLGWLASFCRLIMFDRRGTGVSDAVPDTAMPTWEEWADDVRAVLDAAGSERAAVLADGPGGAIGMLFTAMQPERVTALILANTTARRLRADDYPIGIPPETVDDLVKMFRASWGTPDLVPVVRPSQADDPEHVQRVAMGMRATATPRNAAAQVRYVIESLDARKALPQIQVPTLVLHNRGNPVVSIEHGRYLADHIDGAKFVELPGADTFLASSPTAMEEIGEFLTGERRPVEVDRILTTLLFTDIVGSTERAAWLGDHAWRSLLDAHDRTVREQLRRFRGKEINTTGDGFVASFDGPARAIRCGQAIVDATTKLGIQLRIGLHTGECEVRGDDLGGLAVHIAARIGSLAQPGKVLVSSTVKDLVGGSAIEFSDRQEQELKGVPGTWTLFSVSGLTGQLGAREAAEEHT
jgi:class 3 adenylate cyclase/alpha-beta hydrolase superfamily lysophospholipase